MYVYKHKNELHNKKLLQGIIHILIRNYNQAFLF